MNPLSAVPMVLLAGGMVADVFGPEPYTGLPLLAAVPITACLVTGFGGALAWALAACAASVVTDLAVQRPGMALVVDVLDVALISVFALILKKLVDRQGQRLAAARHVAEVAQRAVLPDPPRRVGEVEVGWRYECAQVDALIGGDFFAVEKSRFGVRALIGDVRGKGLRAVSSMAALTGAFRGAAARAPTLGALAEELDGVVERLADSASCAEESETFATALFVEVSPSWDEVRILSAGHPPPYLVRGGRVRALESRRPAPPLGMARLTGRVPLDPLAVEFRRNDFVLLSTDGVTEARDGRGTFYDPVIGLDSRQFGDSSEVADTLVTEVVGWTHGNHHDDIAVLVLRRLPDLAPVGGGEAGEGAGPRGPGGA